MTKIVLVAGGDFDGVLEVADRYVGVDVGALHLINHDLPLDLAVGDFDSVNTEDMTRILKKATCVIQAPAEKDDTDLELALKEVFKRFPRARVRIYAAFGGRIDHMLANLFLASEPEIAPYMEQIELVDRQNVICFRPKGTHVLKSIIEMPYISFMPSDDACLTIRHAKYPLNAGNYFYKKCYASNEFIGRDMEIELDKGYVVIIYSKDRN